MITAYMTVFFMRSDWTLDLGVALLSTLLHIRECQFIHHEYFNYIKECTLSLKRVAPESESTNWGVPIAVTQYTAERVLTN